MTLFSRIYTYARVCVCVCVCKIRGGKKPYANTAASDFEPS